MGKWLLKMGIMVAVGLGLTYVEGKMLNHLVFGDVHKEIDDQKTDGDSKVVLNETEYEVR